MKLVRLDSIFDVKYGHSLELNKLTITSKDNGIAFISRRGGDNGVDCYVEPLDSVAPNSTGDITCALGGSVLATFLQERPYYTAFHVACLTSRIKLSKSQLLFYVACIGSNRYKYSYGRQANKTIKELLIPDFSEIPKWVNKAVVELPTDTDLPAISQQTPQVDTKKWKSFSYDEIFVIKKGYYNKKPPISINRIGVPFIGASENHNGVTSFISMSDLNKYSRDGKVVIDEKIGRKLFDAKCITVPNNGASVAESSYQSVPFTCSHDVNPIYLKDKNVEFSSAIGLFLATLIRAEKYRWSYGRKWRPIRMSESTIKLPVKANGTPDWFFMENYIKSLRYSSQI